MNHVKKPLSLLIFTLIVFGKVLIFSAEKRPFTIDDFASWRSIESAMISNDGKWATFAYRKVKADADFHVKNLVQNKEYKISGGADPRFSDDSRWIAFRLNHPWKEAEKK